MPCSANLISLQEINRTIQKPADSSELSAADETGSDLSREMQL